MISLLTDVDSSRLRYVAEVLFSRWLQVDYAIVHLPEEVAPETLCIVYGAHSVAGNIRIFNEGLLSETKLRSQLPSVVFRKDYPLIFESPASGNFDLPFDLLSAVFFCLSRYEEYITEKRDVHGRFEAKDSIFYGNHSAPYLDKWVMLLEHLIRDKNPDWIRPRTTTWMSTMDMDIAFAYKGRGFLRLAGATAKDLLNGRFTRLKKRVAVFKGRNGDPYDTFDFFLEENESNLKRIFIPVADRGSFDNNLDVENAVMRQHILKLSKQVTIGLHPGYESLGKPDILRNEKAKLERLLQNKVTESRQHFLRLSLPDTYLLLASLGIEKDYSMGFHDEVGFRSGTAYSHPFYDVKNERTLPLELIPLIAMDSAMKNYMELSPAAALDAIRDLLQQMHETGGVFTTVWHNHSLSDTEDWEGWKTVFETTPEIVRSHR